MALLQSFCQNRFQRLRLGAFYTGKDVKLIHIHSDLIVMWRTSNRIKQNQSRWIRKIWTSCNLLIFFWSFSIHLSANVLIGPYTLWFGSCVTNSDRTQYTHASPLFMKSESATRRSFSFTCYLQIINWNKLLGHLWNDNFLGNLWRNFVTTCYRFSFVFKPKGLSELFYLPL